MITVYILAALLGIAIAFDIYLYSQLQLDRAISASKTATIVDTTKRKEEFFNKVMDLSAKLDGRDRKINSLNNDIEELESMLAGKQEAIYKLETRRYHADQTAIDRAKVIGVKEKEIEYLRKQRDEWKKIVAERDEELSKLKANTVSNHTVTLNVDSDKLAKEIMKQIREKCGKNLK